MTAIVLALGSSLVYGVSDFLGGLRSRSLPVLSVLLVSQASALAALSLIAVAIGDDPPDAEFLVYGVMAGLAEAIGIAALYRGLAVGVTAIVAPVAAIAPIVGVVTAIALGEAPTAIQGVGIALALAGVAVLSSGSSADSSHPVAPSVAFGLLTALGFGGFQVALDAASERSVAWALLTARITTVAVYATAFLATRPALDVRSTQVPQLALIGLLIVAADALYAIATTQGLLSVVAVLASLYPVVTVALARLYFNERIRRQQLLGIATTLAGAAIISVGSG